MDNPDGVERNGDSDEFEALLRKTLAHALAYVASAPTASVAATASLEELRERLLRELPQRPADPAAVIDQLVADAGGGLAYSTGGRFFGWVLGGVVPAALAADWLTAVWDQNAGMYAVSPAGAVVEEACGRWLLELFGLSSHCSFALVTGCQMAHVTCLAAARNAVLRRAGWDVESKGLYGAPPIQVLTGDQRHGSIERALRLLGMGKDNLHDLPVERSGQLAPATLEGALRNHADSPTIVLLQAGDLNTGSFDSFAELIPLARRFAAWTHVDGAFGMWAATSPAHRHLLNGVEQADSWAVDGHKWLNVPYDCGYAIVADPGAHHRSMGHKASYLYHSAQARDPIDWNPEYSRRARGFATYAAIASLGRQGIGEIVERCCRHAAAIVEGAGRLPGVEVLSEPVINQGLIRFLDTRAGATEADHDRRTEDVTSRIVATGEALFACTTWRGKRAMRVSVSGWRTSDDDVRRVLGAIEGAL